MFLGNSIIFAGVGFVTQGDSINLGTFRQIEPKIVFVDAGRPSGGSGGILINGTESVVDRLLLGDFNIEEELP